LHVGRYALAIDIKEACITRSAGLSISGGTVSLLAVCVAVAVLTRGDCNQASHQDDLNDEHELKKI
jgi:hypothetical protein